MFVKLKKFKDIDDTLLKSPFSKQNFTWINNYTDKTNSYDVPKKK